RAFAPNPAQTTFGSHSLLRSLTFTPAQRQAFPPNPPKLFEFHFTTCLCQAPHELRSGTEGTSAAHRGAFRCRADLPQRLSKRGLARAALADGLSRNTGNTRAAVEGVGGKRVAEHRRWLLWHHASTHQGHRRSGKRPGPPRTAERRAVPAPQWPGCPHGHATNKLCEHR